MHIPDGFLDAKTAGVTIALSTAAVAWAVRRVRMSLPAGKIPLLGLAAAFVFAAQMLNFPVAGGTSGHLIGGVLASVLLGPNAGLLVMTSVLVIQSLVFADGGILALGANVFNMGIVGSVVGYAIYRVVRSKLAGLQGQLAAAAFAAWCSVVLASTGCTIQLAVSGTIGWNTAFPAMTGIHMVIGIGEALITALVLAAVAATRPDLLDDKQTAASPAGSFLVYGLIVAMALAVLVSPFASSWPDGLEKVAESLGFIDAAVETPTIPSPVPDYEMPGISSASMATAVAGAVGTVIMFVLTWLLGRLLVVRMKKECVETTG